MVKVKYIRRKCYVRGCRNIGSYAITRRVFGGVVICEECLRGAVAAIDALKQPTEAAETKAEEPTEAKAEPVKRPARKKAVKNNEN